MENNKLIKYKENIFTRIVKLFKKIFPRKNVLTSKNIIKESSINNKTENNFLEKIQIKEDKEVLGLKELKVQYDNGEIDEDDLSEEEIDKLVDLYESETEKLNNDTLRRKRHIEQMLKELKNL